jgi:hypothetical protein
MIDVAKLAAESIHRNSNHGDKQADSSKVSTIQTALSDAPAGFDDFSSLESSDSQSFSDLSSSDSSSSDLGSSELQTSELQASERQASVGNRFAKVTEINYRRNTESDYTEKIEALDSAFDYEQNRDYWWSEPELSILYGTPLYEECSLAQRQALNHLYWATQYNQTAATEANAVLYNQVTTGVFDAVGGYSTLCEELDLETEQERHHIHAFHNIGYKTKRALLGKSGFSDSIRGKSSSKSLRGGSLPGQAQNDLVPKFLVPKLKDSAFRFVTHQVFLREQTQFYSPYLQDIEQKGGAIPAQTTGLLGQIAPRSLLQFFTLNCGSSPFIACVFYVTRFMANMLLKNYEYRYVQYHRELEKQGQFIPVPTAVSMNHLMDEAFHTTTSQLIAQDLYKEFPKATAYEKWMANLIIYRAQVVSLQGLSGGLPAIFRSDASLMLSYYRLLQSPIFGFSSQEALMWLEKSLCHENEGFHSNIKHHQRLLADLRRHFEPIDYLWKANREVRIMAAGGSVDRAIKDNVKSFKIFSQQFSESVA